MTTNNVELVRRWFAALSSSPEEALAAVAELWDPDLDYYPVRKFPEARPCHGLNELSQFVAGYLDAYSRFDWAIQGVTAVGDDRVLARGSLRAEGRGSGLRVAGDHYSCVWLRHGRLFRVEDHLTLRGALHALGLQADNLEDAGLQEEH